MGDSEPVVEYLGISNPKDDLSWRQTELIPRCQRKNFNEDLSCRKKELIPRRQQNQRGTPDKESQEIFIPKGYLIWRQRETNPEVPAVKLLRSVQFIRRYQLAPKGNNSKVPAGEFCASRKVFT